MFNSPPFQSILDLSKVFPDEKTCHLYLAAQRWSTGELVCPHCSHNSAYVFKDGIRYKCKGCKIMFTAKTGTFMEGSRLATIKWFMAMYLINHKKGISSIQLSKDLAVTQKTAWFILHRIRHALGNEPREFLDGVVEIDETFVGGKAKFKHKDKRPKYNPGRGWKDKTPVFGMLQRGGKLKAMVIPDVLMITLRRAARNNIVAGSRIYGDGYVGYKALQRLYDVYNVDHGKGFYVNGDCHTNTIECAWSHLKRSIIGIYTHVSRKHLNNYVQEFTFRYNYRNLNVQQQINTIIGLMCCRLKYKELVA